MAKATKSAKAKKATPKGKAGKAAAKPPARKEGLELELRVVPLAEIKMSKGNVRTHNGVSVLAESIEAHGLLQPPVVDGSLSVLYGHGRVAAVRKLKWKTMPVLVAKGGVTPAETMTKRIVENRDRSFTSVEEGAAYAKLRELLPKESATIKNLAEMVGKPEKYVARRLQLLALPKSVQAAIESGACTFQAALLVAPLFANASQEMRKAMEEDLGGHMTTHELERFYRTFGHWLRSSLWSLNKKFEGLPVCTTCPHRGAYQADLFEDLPDTRMAESIARSCVEPKCFRKKLDMVVAAASKAAVSLGATILLDEEAEVLGVAGFYPQSNRKFRRLSTAKDSLAPVLVECKQSCVDFRAYVYVGDDGLETRLTCTRPDHYAKLTQANDTRKAGPSTDGTKAAAGGESDDPSQGTMSGRHKAAQEIHYFHYGTVAQKILDDPEMQLKGLGPQVALFRLLGYVSMMEGGIGMLSREKLEDSLNLVSLTEPEHTWIQLRDWKAEDCLRAMVQILVPNLLGMPQATALVVQDMSRLTGQPYRLDRTTLACLSKTDVEQVVSSLGVTKFCAEKKIEIPTGFPAIGKKKLIDWLFGDLVPAGLALPDRFPEVVKGEVFRGDIANERGVQKRSKEIFEPAG